jgi:nucleotide-binding universal stress UspA family protein
VPNQDPAGQPARRAVLVAAVDDSRQAAEVVSTATALVSALPHAELHLVHVVDAVDPPSVTLGGSPLTQPGETVLLEQGRAYLKGVMHDVAAACPPGTRVVGHVAAGPAWREVLQVAVDLDAALLIVGSRPIGALERLLLGSVAQTIVQRSPLPVLVAKGRQTLPGELKPACPACLSTQQESGGETLWCPQHQLHHPRAHLFTEVDEVVVPEGNSGDDCALKAPAPAGGARRGERCGGGGGKRGQPWAPGRPSLPRRQRCPSMVSYTRASSRCARRRCSTTSRCRRRPS